MTKLCRFDWILVSFPWQDTDVLYIVPLFFVDEWRKFIRYSLSFMFMEATMCRSALTGTSAGFVSGSDRLRRPTKSSPVSNVGNTLLLCPHGGFMFTYESLINGDAQQWVCFIHPLMERLNQSLGACARTKLSMVIYIQILKPKLSKPAWQQSGSTYMLLLFIFVNDVFTSKCDLIEEDRCIQRTVIFNQIFTYPGNLVQMISPI